MNSRASTFTTIATLSLLLLAELAHAIEEPEFEIIERIGKVEIRQYVPYHVASIRVPTAFEDAGDEAFRPLFKYITGNNSGEVKIDMTAPVEQVQVAAGQQEVAFVMPSEFDFDGLPQPNDTSVSLTSKPQRLIAALRYNGNWSEKRFLEHEVKLREQLAGTAYKACGKATIARFNPPFWPRMFRRNEVHLLVTQASCPDTD